MNVRALVERWLVLRWTSRLQVTVVVVVVELHSYISVMMTLIDDDDDVRSLPSPVNFVCHNTRIRVSSRPTLSVQETHHEMRISEGDVTYTVLSVYLLTLIHRYPLNQKQSY